jgi:hypothetical protein
MSSRKADKRSRNRLIVKGVILNVLTNLPVLIGLLILASSRGPLTSTRLGFISFVVGLSGVITVLRKEIPMSIGTVRGKSAIAIGSAFTLMCWLLSLYFLLFGLT